MARKKPTGKAREEQLARRVPKPGSPGARRHSQLGVSSVQPDRKNILPGNLAQLAVAADDLALRASLNAMRVCDGLLCATCSHRMDEHEHGNIDCEHDFDDGESCDCREFVLPDTHDRWAYTPCKCGRSRECNEVGVVGCSCETSDKYVFVNGDRNLEEVNANVRRARGESHQTLKEAQGGGSNAVERQGLDLHRWTLEKVLPEAVAACDAGIEREKALERDVPKAGEKRVVYCAEVRGMTAKINGVIQEQRGWYKTTSQMPHGLKPIMGKSIGELHWCMRMSLMRERVTKDPEQARRMSSGNAIQFVIVSGGIELAGGEL